MKPSLLRTLACALVVAAAAGCADRNPVTGDLPTGPAPDPHATRFECRANVTERTLECAAPTPAGGRGNLLVGGQDVYVKLRSSNVVFSAGVLSADLSVQNLLGQPMGTTDGTTPVSTGVRIFFYTGPTTTGGTGSVTVQNPDGIGVFTAAGQPFFQYGGILGPGATSATKPWRFQLDPGVTTFSFSVFVSAPMPLESGWVDLYEPNPVLAPGQAVELSPLVYTGVGTLLENAPVTFASSNDAVATVSADGVVTGVALGTATITATSGPRTGTTLVTVADVDASVPTVTSFTITPGPVNAGDSVTFSVTAADAGAGVALFTANVRAPFVNTIFRPSATCLARDPSSGTRASGTFTCRAAIPPGVAPGTWSVTSIFVSDVRGNTRSLNAAALAAAGFPNSFPVANPAPDTSGPVLTGFTVVSTAITAPDSVTVTVTATDAGTGIASVTPSFTEPLPAPISNRSFSCSTTTPVTGTASSGTFTCKIGFPPGIRPGAWWGQVRLQDLAGNNTFANTFVYPYSSLGYVNVTSAVRDTTPPTLRGVSMPATAAPGDSVTVTLGTADAGTGVAGAKVFFRSQEYYQSRICEQSALVAGTAAFGTLQCRFGLPAASGTGTWTMVEIELVDVTGNTRYVLTGELQALGYPSTIVVTP
ncbi:MAG TPA: Ig-like domain-containing protein [Longimicrobium sp.]|nr:Ig-like domain-containing protein [Longimicrobium sp.]